MKVTMFTSTQVRLGVVIGIIVCLLISALPAQAITSSAPYLYPSIRPYCGTKPIRSVKTTQKVVAMTFDDGPWPVNTDAILDSLAMYGARSTFFMVSNNARANPDIARRVLKRGHEIANHSKTHSTYDPNKIALELPLANQDLFQVIGVIPWAFRSPGLTTGTAINNFAANTGMCNISTDADIGDWRSPRISSYTICERFKKALHPGYINLVHDGGTHANTVKAVPCMLSYAKKQGYKFMTISQMLNMGPDVN